MVLEVAGCCWFWVVDRNLGDCVFSVPGVVGVIRVGDGFSFSLLFFFFVFGFDCSRTSRVLLCFPLLFGLLVEGDMDGNCLIVEKWLGKLFEGDISKKEKVKIFFFWVFLYFNKGN